MDCRFLAGMQIKWRLSSERDRSHVLTAVLTYLGERPKNDLAIVCAMLSQLRSDS